MSLLSPTLEAFWAVVRKGTVQDASKILGLTQTGVTQRIRSLEKQLKTTLFMRSRTGMKLTAEGEALLHFVKSTIDLQGMALSKIQRATSESIIEVSISGPPSILRSRVIPHLSSVTQKYPHLRFLLDLADSEKSIEKLKIADCDIIALEQHQLTREMDSKKLKIEKYGFYGPAKWKSRKASDLFKIENLIQISPYAQTTLQLLEKYNLKTKIHNDRHFVNDTEAALAMAANNLGFCVLPVEIAETSIKKNQLSQLAPNYFYEKKMCLAWYPRPEMSNYFQALIQLIN